MLKDSIKLTGRLSIKKYDKEGKVNYEKEVPNLVVTSGKEFIAKRIVSSQFELNPNYDPLLLDANDESTFKHLPSTGPSEIGFMGIGDDASTPAVAQTALQNELSRVAVNSANASGGSVTFNASFGAGVGTGALTEAGLFNLPSTAIVTFDSDNNVDDGNDLFNNLANHGLETGDRVTYTDGGGAAITGLVDGGSYFVIKISSSSFKLASTLQDANNGTAIDIEGAGPGLGVTQKLTAGTMLCRTTFPIINKSATETVAISWVITVG